MALVMSKPPPNLIMVEETRLAHVIPMGKFFGFSFPYKEFCLDNNCDKAPSEGGGSRNSPTESPLFGILPQGF